ncbi:ExeM/NucH family extracellular endonuclease [Vibrio sp. SCSIO 43136]|uniref:ExeM/NucH family extracellular endonuclease n=1 Tax=Vibrio sp. SCSIO 43136 TaxID=2819101 RepID=UPI002074D77D|nr:ExeM/NucH family extracellular endonuclease [Vibrio sp. SCSIO 43136]USD65508.1 ExeM/NucH family extracellular endonuclease [Vibrio sp. SCSIO 43136]
MNNKITLLAGAISAVLSGGAFADINNVVISEYVESSVDAYAKNSAIEITNTGSTDVSLDSYAIYYSSYKNKVLKPNGTDSVLKGVTIGAGESIVIVAEDATSDLTDATTANSATVINSGSYGSIRFDALNFNGDDAVWIGAADNADTIHDIIGSNSSSWGKEVTLRRTSDAKTADATYVAAHWKNVGTDIYTDLGKPTFEDPAPVSEGACTMAGDTIVVKSVGEVQGEGNFSPLIAEGEYISTDSYKVTGVVSAVTSYPASGFYLYAEDGNEKTSDGVFVYSKSASDDLVGKTVCVVAKAKEYYGLTQLALQDDWEIMDDTVTTVAPVELKRIASDTTFASTLERYEGMLVTTVAEMGNSDAEQAEIDAIVDQVTVTDEGESEAELATKLQLAKEAKQQELAKKALRVSRSFSFDYDSFRNNMVLAYKRPNPQPNQDHVAGSAESLAQAAENNDFRVYVESDGKAANGQIPYYPAFAQDPQNNYVRINDSVVGLTGVLDYSYSNFRIIVPKALEESGNITFVHNTPRTSAPSINEDYGKDGFTIKVATQNVLNYFNSPYGGSSNNFGDNRGADSQQEFERQQAKLVQAIYGLDADVLGLMEIENNGFGDFGAIKELLAAINLKYYDEDYGDRGKQNSIHNRYVFVGFDKNGDTILDDQDTVGSDAITTGVIYRPSKVALVGGKIIPMPSQHAPQIVDENGAVILDSKGEVRESGNNYQRNTVAATFKVLHTGKKLTVAVNHLKSKGSTCYEDWQGWQEWENFDPVKDDVKNDDYQGSCENFRVAAAYHLGNEMEKIAGDKVILGDMNAYAHEDPMLVLTSNPTGKTIKAAGYTFFGDIPQFGPEGAVITKTFGYLNAVDLKTAEGETSWSYSYNDEVGSLDHMLISSSLKARLVDATDWHINAPESSLFDYSDRYKGGDSNEPNPFYAETPYRSSDHDSAIISLGYKYGEAGDVPVSIGTKSGRADIAFPVGADAKAGDVATISISPAMERVNLPKVTLTANGQQTVMFDVTGLESGRYTVSMALTGLRDTESESTLAEQTSKVIESKSLTVDIAKRDSSNVKPVTPEYDGTGGSGGSLGLGALLAMFGLGWLRRRR